MTSPPPSSIVYKPFLGQAGTSPPISFPASHDSILSPSFPSGSEDDQEGRTMLTQQVAARQESQEHEQHNDEEHDDDDTRSEEGNEEVRANEQENAGEEGEDPLSGSFFSPLPSVYEGDPPRRFVFWGHEHAGGPHLPQRAQTGPRPYQGRVETDGGDEVNTDKEAKSNSGLYDKVDDNAHGDEDKKEVANSNDEVDGNTQAENDNNEAANDNDEVDDNTHGDDDKKEAAAHGNDEVDDNTQADDDKDEAAIKEKVKSRDQQALEAPSRKRQRVE